MNSWFAGDNGKKATFEAMLAKCSITLAEMEQVLPERQAIQQLLKRMNPFTIEELFGIIGPRHPDERLFGVEALRTDYIRLIINRFKPFQACALHDHGTLAGEALSWGPMSVQKYSLDMTLPFEAQIPIPIQGTMGQETVRRGEITSILAEDIHALKSLNPLQDGADVSIFYRTEGPLGKLRDWRSWEPDSCINCRAACSALIAKQ